MRKIITILLLTVFTFNSVGYFAFFVISRYQARKAMWEKISLNQDQHVLDVIVIPNNPKNYSNADFTRLNKDEFRYKGKRYDIVRSEKVGNTTHYFVINDKKEENLFASLKKNLNSQIAQNDHSKKDQRNLLYDFIKQMLLTGVESMKPAVADRKYPKMIRFSYENPVPSINPPPPQQPVIYS